jgi:hypothetical protein
MVLENYNTISNLDQSDPVFYFYKATNSFVFSHAAFPNLVLKIMEQEQALQSKRSIDHAQRVFSEMGFLYAHIPPAEIIDLFNTKTLLVMEKAIGNTDEFLAQEEMEQEFEMIDRSHEMAIKWKRMTREVALATASIGYWDAHRQNLIWDSRIGWSFIDFENLNNSSPSIKRGLTHLIEIVPPQFIDEIYDVAETVKVLLDKQRIDAKANRLAQFILTRSISKWNKERPIPRILHKEHWETCSWERKILEYFDEYRKKPYFKNYPPAQTMLSWQPFITDIGKQNPNTMFRTQIIFEKALKNLQTAGVILTWKSEKDHHHPTQPSYKIFF